VTGRFAIATSSGLTTPPANSTQPDGTDIPWGTGELVNPNNADALPSFASSIFLASSIVSNSSSTLAVVTSSTTGSATPVITSAGATSSASPASPTAQSTSGAMTTFDIRVLGAAAAVTLALSFVW
jgi:hypothetical protein